MSRLLVVFAFSIVLAGCTSTLPHPLVNVSGLSENNLGQVVTMLYGDDVRLKENETEKLKHWRFNGGRIYTAEKFANAALELKLGYFDKYCSSLGGTFSGPTTYQNTRVREVACNQEKTNTAIFRLFAANYSCQLRTAGDSGYDKEYPYACRVWLDAFQWKSKGGIEDLEKEYVFQSDMVGFNSIQIVAAEKQREQDERAKKAMAYKAEFDRQLQLMKVEEQRLKERAIRDQPQVRSVGQKICRSVEVTQRKVLGYAMNQPVYGEPIKLKAKVTAFTEQSSGEKIQIRISGIQANGENLARIDGDVVFENGAVIWDVATNWGLCY